MQPYRLGLDLGTNSIGWAALTLDTAGLPDGLLGLGAHIFSDGRNPKDQTSLAVARRLARGARRRRDRYLRRRDDLMNVLIAVGLMPADEAERQALAALDPYALRARGAHSALKPYELGRALFHLDQRRGFKSNRKTDSGKDNKLTAGIEALTRRIAESGAATLGEYLYRRRLRGKMVRARPEAGFYPARQLYENEFDTIRAIQEPAHTLRPDQWDCIRGILFFQRPLKPVDPGWCLLEEGERRAPRALPCAQEFRMLQEVNNLRILRPGERALPLSPEQRDRTLRELRTKKEVKLETLIKLLGLSSDARVNLLDENRKALKGDEAAARLSHKDAFGTRWHGLSFGCRTEIVRKLLDTEDPGDIERVARAAWGLNDAAARIVAAMPMPEGYARLSEKAIDRLLPVMEEQGLGYAEAVASIEEYGHHSDFRPDQALDRLPYYGAVLTRHMVGADPTKPVDDEVGHYGRIANPTVHIGLGQVRRVVNRLISIYGKPQEIVVELARALKQNKEERDAERDRNSANEKANRIREEQIRAAGGVPSPHLLRKLRLWEEQSYGACKVCPFSLQPISFAMALGEQAEIEHILPFPKTLDDSMANKVLALRSANRAKADRSPFDAFQSNPSIGGFSYDYAKMLVAADKLPVNKRWRFLPDAMERFEDEAAFLDRQLNETKYLSRITRTYLAHLYNEKAEQRLRVRAIPGRLTAMLRGKWGLSRLLHDHNRVFEVDGPMRKNRDNHKHHAIDAVVVAMTDQALLQRISQLNSDPQRARLIEALPEISQEFYHSLREQLDRLIVSHRPDHGSIGSNGQTSGALHNDTAYGLMGPGRDGNWKVVSRAALRSFDDPKKMAAALRSVRDDALRAALIAEWESFDPAEAAPSPGRSVKPRKKPNGEARRLNRAVLFADHVAFHGISLNGRTVKVRRVRMIEELAVVPIADRRRGKNDPRTGEPYKSPYKAYKPDGNAFGDIYRLPNGGCKMAVIRRFDANQPGFKADQHRPHPACRKLARLHIDDMVAVDEAGRRRILRVVKMSGQTITLADHFEAGALKTRHDSQDDPFRYLQKSAGELVKLGLRKVGVDEVGRVSDPGPPTLRNR